LLAEQAGIMVLVAPTGAVKGRPLEQALLAALRKTLRVAQLGAVMLAVLALTIVPFVLLGLLTYGIFVSRHDIKFYVENRPPGFWLAACVGVILLLGALAAGTWLYVRWAFALPILLFEDQFGRAALRASRERVHGAGWRIGIILFGWLLGALLVGVAVE